jgi:hypothetical protein
MIPVLSCGLDTAYLQVTKVGSAARQSIVCVPKEWDQVTEDVPSEWEQGTSNRWKSRGAKRQHKTMFDGGQLVYLADL